MAQCCLTKGGWLTDMDLLSQEPDRKIAEPRFDEQPSVLQKLQVKKPVSQLQFVA